MRSDFSFFHTIRVRHNEVDGQGIVYNSNYLMYMDTALDEMIRISNCTYDTLHAAKFDICHVKTTIEYLSSAFCCDEIEVGLRTLAVGNKSFTLQGEIFRKGEDNVLVRADMIFSGYSVAQRKGLPIPDFFREILNRWK